jgi:hypothetical protein
MVDGDVRENLGGRRMSTSGSADALVLISCSAAKRRTPAAPVRAIDRYDGIFFRVIRKAMADGRMSPRTHVAIISAKFGLIATETTIPFYDQKMDKSRAAVLRQSVRKELQQLLREHKFAKVFINLGRHYAVLIDDLPELRAATWAGGPIGKRAAAMKSWLESAAQEYSHSCD